MHEISLARDLLEMICEQKRLDPCSKVVRAKVRVGELSGVDGKALRSAFEMIAEGSCVTGCLLDVEVTPLLGKCASCGRKFEIRQYTVVCHHCQSREIDIVDGDDIVLSEIEIESPEVEESCNV